MQSNRSSLVAETCWPVCQTEQLPLSSEDTGSNSMGEAQGGGGEVAGKQASRAAAGRHAAGSGNLD